jgi:hypothetical protein
MALVEKLALGFLRLTESWISRVSYYQNLYRVFLGFSAPAKRISAPPLDDLSRLSGRQIYFYVPAKTAGAQFIVYDLLPALNAILGRVGARCVASSVPPKEPVDWLISFKSAALLNSGIRAKRHILLICDEAEKVWSKIARFDWIVSSSSPEFAALCATRNPNTVLIDEFDTTMNLSEGKKILSQKQFDKLNTIGWHGGNYSKAAAMELVPILQMFAAGLERPIRYLLVGGVGSARLTKCGLVEIEEIPWSIDAMERFGRECRLAVVPSRDSIRTSFLKPSARMRKCFTFGVPAIGDGRVPEAKRLSKYLGVPYPKGPLEWYEALNILWKPAFAEEVAHLGWSYVSEFYSDVTAAHAWCTFLSGMINEENVFDL